MSDAVAWPGAEIERDETPGWLEYPEHLGEPPPLELRRDVMERQAGEDDVEVIGWGGNRLDRGQLERRRTALAGGVLLCQGDHLRRGIDAYGLSSWASGARGGECEPPGPTADIQNAVTWTNGRPLENALVICA
jgi:hypothetical protein